MIFIDKYSILYYKMPRNPSWEWQFPVEGIKNLWNDYAKPPILSPIGEVGRPGSLLFEGAPAYESLFSGRFVSRSPGAVRRQGLLDRFLFRSSLRKIEADSAGDFDISVVLYPMGMDLAAWGIVVDRVGRVFEIVPRSGGFVEFSYQGGCCRTRREWRTLVGTRRPDDEQQIRMFYNRAHKLAADRVTLAGTVGFGLWDALWMSLDVETSYLILEQQPDFAMSVFRYWAAFHLTAVKAMLDAGIRIIFLREHPDGFRQGEETVSLVDSFVQEHMRDISRIVHSRGGRLFLDCDADDILHSDYPMEWGFDGIGPLLFRDRNDLLAAADGLGEELMLVAALQQDSVDERPRLQFDRKQRIIMSASPTHGPGTDYATGIAPTPDDAEEERAQVGFTPLMGIGT